MPSNNYDLSRRVDPLIEDIIVPNTVEALLRLANHPKKSTQEWINSVRSTGSLLAALTDEQYAHVCFMFRDEQLTIKGRRSKLLKSSPTIPIDPESVEEGGLFS
jgi:hypothetical protein